MAVVIFKAPCVGPGCVWYEPSKPVPGIEVSIPDWHVAELDPKCLIVITAASPDPEPAPKATEGTLLKDYDWQRAIEDTEVLKLRQPDPPPVVDVEPVAHPTSRRRVHSTV